MNPPLDGEPEIWGVICANWNPSTDELHRLFWSDGVVLDDHDNAISVGSNEESRQIALIFQKPVQEFVLLTDRQALLLGQELSRQAYQIHGQGSW